jgi:hypothetical protein
MKKIAQLALRIFVLSTIVFTLFPTTENLARAQVRGSAVSTPSRFPLVARPNDTLRSSLNS